MQNIQLYCLCFMLRTVFLNHHAKLKITFKTYTLTRTGEHFEWIWLGKVELKFTFVQTATGSPSSHYHLENRATDNYRCSLGLGYYYMDKFSFPLGLAVHPKQTLIRLTLKQQTEVDLFLVCSSGVDYYWCFLLFAWNSFSSYGCFSFRRLHTLNKCASMKLDVNLPKKKVSAKIFLLLQLWQV